MDKELTFYIESELNCLSYYKQTHYYGQYFEFLPRIATYFHLHQVPNSLFL